MYIYKRKDINKKKYYVVNLKSLANTDSDEGFGAQSLNGEGDATRDVSNCPKSLEDSHFLSLSLSLLERERRERKIVF